MAEMTTLVAALYRKYTTEPKRGFDVVSPSVTSRFEVFYEEACSGMRVGFAVPLYMSICSLPLQEHERWIEFKPQ